MASVRYALRLIARKPAVLALLLPLPIVNTILKLLRGQIASNAGSPMDQLLSVLSMVLELLDSLLLQSVALGLMLDGVLEQQSAPGWYGRYLRLHWYKPVVVLLVFGAVATPLLFIYLIIYLLSSALLQITSDNICFTVLYYLIISVVTALTQLMLASMTQLSFKEALRQTLSRGSRIVQMAAISILVMLASFLVTTIGHAMGVTDVSSVSINTLLHVGGSIRQSTTVLRYSGWLSFIQLLVSAPSGIFMLAYSFVLVYTKKHTKSTITTRR